MTVIRKACEILPIAKIIVETASFDIQKIKNPNIQGAEYRQGEQLDFWNVREYVLFRDGHTCQCCKGKSKDKILNVHHIESRKTGGNAPNNLMTLCETCHNGYHEGTIMLPKNIKRGMSFRDAAFMGIMRWALYDKLKELYPNVFMTFGYITKNTRIENGLPKEHYIDARCISGNPLAKSLGIISIKRKCVVITDKYINSPFARAGIEKEIKPNMWLKDFVCLIKLLIREKNILYSPDEQRAFSILGICKGTKSIKAVFPVKRLHCMKKQKNI